MCQDIYHNKISGQFIFNVRTGKYGKYNPFITQHILQDKASERERARVRVVHPQLMKPHCYWQTTLSTVMAIFY